MSRESTSAPTWSDRNFELRLSSGARATIVETLRAVAGRDLETGGYLYSFARPRYCGAVVDKASDPATLPQAFPLRLRVPTQARPFTDDNPDGDCGRRENRVRRPKEPRRDFIDLTHDGNPDAEARRCNERPPTTHG